MYHRRVDFATDLIDFNYLLIMPNKKSTHEKHICVNMNNVIEKFVNLTRLYSPAVSTYHIEMLQALVQRKMNYF